MPQKASSEDFGNCDWTDILGFGLGTLIIAYSLITNFNIIIHDSFLIPISMAYASLILRFVLAICRYRMVPD